MNPDRLFDYLDGKLAPAERAQLEERLMADEQLRQQFKIAREIHRGGGVSREVIVPGDPERGGRLGRRIAVAAIVLVFANVIGGLAVITYKNTKPSVPAGPRFEPLVRAAAERAMPLPTLGPEVIQVTAPRAEWENLASLIIAKATALGGEARRELPHESMMTVLADIPTAREEEFRRAILSPAPTSPAPTNAALEPTEKTTIQVRIAEAAP